MEPPIHQRELHGTELAIVRVEFAMELHGRREALLFVLLLLRLDRGLERLQLCLDRAQLRASLAKDEVLRLTLNGS